MAGPIILGLGIIGKYLLKHGIKKAVKKYGKTAVSRFLTNKNAKKLLDAKKLLKAKRAALEGRKVSTDFGKALDYSYKTALRGRKISTKGIKKVSTKGIKKALEYSPPFMLRNMMRDAIAKKTIKKSTSPLKKKLMVGGAIYGGVTGGLTGAAYEKGKKYKKSKKKSKKKEEKSWFLIPERERGCVINPLEGITSVNTLRIRESLK